MAREAQERSLRILTEHGTSLHETAAFFNIAASSSIRNWKNQFERLFEDALQPKKKGRLSMKKDSTKQPKQAPVEGSPEALQAKINRLRMENEYLKKLNALVQAKEKSPNERAGVKLFSTLSVHYQYSGRLSTYYVSHLLSL